jgi:hypothetical protein
VEWHPSFIISHFVAIGTRKPFSQKYHSQVIGDITSFFHLSMGESRPLEEDVNAMIHRINANITSTFSWRLLHKSMIRGSATGKMK